MTELDIGLKAAARRLSWQRGFATRIDVPLRVYVDRAENSSGFEEATDLDVLAVHVNHEGRVGASIYDCKTSAKRSTERALWLRGVADLFDADMAWLVREEKVTAAARQLASRLDIGVMNRADLELQMKIDKFVAVPEHIAYQRLFNPEDILKHRDKMQSGNRRLEPLRDYARYDYWVEASSQGLSQAIAQLARVREVLSHKDPLHLALLLDVTWLYLLALARAAEHVRMSHANNPELALPEYFLGGQAGVRDKQRLAQVFEELTGSKRDGLLPPYFADLIELFARLYVRPSTFVAAMRYCEVLIATLCDGKRTSLDVSSAAAYDIVTAKLLQDTVNFLVNAADLSPSFRLAVRALTMPAPPEPTDGDNSTGEGVAPVDGA